MKISKRHQRHVFREFVEDARRIARGNVLECGGRCNLSEIARAYQFGTIKELEKQGSHSFPSDVKKEVYVIALDLDTENSYLLWTTYLKKGKEDKPELVPESEIGREERKGRIACFLQKYRYVKRVKTISELLEIPDERLEALVQNIKPVVRSRGKLFYIHEVDPRKISFTWDPKIKEEAKNLEELARIKTYHSCGYAAFFKPSIAEVLAQIPKRYLPSTTAFEIPVEMDDPEPEIIGGDYHRARTILYKKGG